MTEQRSFYDIARDVRRDEVGREIDAKDPDHERLREMLIEADAAVRKRKAFVNKLHEDIIAHNREILENKRGLNWDEKKEWQRQHEYLVQRHLRACREDKMRAFELRTKAKDCRVNRALREISFVVESGAWTEAERLKIRALIDWGFKDPIGQMVQEGRLP